VAIPEGALTVAAGQTPLDGTVESTLDLVHEWDLAVICQGARLHVRVPRASRPPNAGEVVHLEARQMYPLS
jgi:hypothetical protein